MDEVCLKFGSFLCKEIKHILIA